MRTPFPYFVITLTAVLLMGCATAYQQQGFFGDGFADRRIDANTFYVEFRGNGATARQTVNIYLLYRCAELTAEAGYDYFVLVGAVSDDQQAVYTTSGHYSATTTTTGNFATTTGTYTPGSTIFVTRPGSAVLLKAFRGQKPAGNPDAFIANEVLQYLGPTVKR